ncbi:autotransporter-associated beta strand repeat-containing protein, partial [bacterium]|nr:autotransporter-associated beta strand repeat-containing protein [bacterium]
MKLKFSILAFSAASLGVVHADSFTGTASTGLWNTSRWNTTTDAAPYSSAWAASSNASFNAGTYTFTGGNSSGAVTIGNITLASGATVNFSAASGTFATSATRTINVGSGSLLDFNTQAMSTAAGTGFIKDGFGVLATSGGGYSGGFTLKAGTIIARGVDAMGGSATNVLTLNGGTVASNATRSFTTAKYGGGIVVGGDVQFGELATVVTLANTTANLSFANNVSLGGATRTFTQGNNGTQLFSGIVSNTSGGITFAANANTDGRFDFTNTANSFTGDVNVNGGEVRFTADGSLGNAANDIILDGGRFGIASGATVTLGAGRQILVGDGVGTGISAPGATGALTYNGVIANKSGETGAWAKQGQGTLILSGISTYTGATTINNGIVQLTTGNDRLPTGTVVSLGQAASANLGTLDLSGRNQQVSGLVSTAGINATTTNNTVTSTAAATLTLDGT